MANKNVYRKTDGRLILDKLKTEHLIQYPLIDLAEIFNLSASQISNIMKKKVKEMVEIKVTARRIMDFTVDTKYEKRALEHNEWIGEWSDSKERAYIKFIK